VHGDHAVRLPEFGQLYGYSERTSVEMWGVEGRIFAIQAHPEFNGNYIQELIINKMYENGRLTEQQKNECQEWIHDPSKPLHRNILLKIIYSFLKSL
jgi:GMP synthase-like glutamine amidotransferase